jgi:hypothetical protein
MVAHIHRDWVGSELRSSISGSFLNDSVQIGLKKRASIPVETR